MLADRVMCAVPNPGPVDVGRTITLGAAPNGYRRFLTAFGGGKPAYFVLSDGADRTITGIWTVNASVPETATITEILGNDRTGDTSGETFAGDCIAWCEVPAASLGGTLVAAPDAAAARAIVAANPLSTAVSAPGFVTAISSATGFALTLPPGGTWDHFVLSFNASGGVASLGRGVKAGGANIASAVPGLYHVASIKRIA